jgi:leucyl aminopeptidase
MQANEFYQKHRQEALPLTFLFTEIWQETRDGFSPYEKNIANTQLFEAKTGQVLLLFDAKGILQKAYIGAEKGQEGVALAKASLLLPPGVFILPNEERISVLIQWGLAQYRFLQYKKTTQKPRVLLLPEALYQRVVIDVDATFLVRDLINTPTNDMGPEKLAMALREVAQKYDAQIEEVVGEPLRTSYPAIHAVGAAAKEAPRLLFLHWGKEEHPVVTLVGKGVCFDSGGLNIKSASNMRLMKKDMGGAAQVIGLAQWIMAHQLPIRLHVLIPAVENAISKEAVRPGDVVTMRNGLTVEIDNTDAEGRLILADAFSKASEYRPALLIDFATLTGAARIAVGTEIAAMFTNDEELALALHLTAIEVQDPLWRLPLFPGYASSLESSIADLANCGPSSYAGATVAALFLERFLAPAIPWVHFDIMAWNLSNKPGKPEGGEAMGIRAVGYYLLKKYPKGLL